MSEEKRMGDESRECLEGSVKPGTRGGLSEE